MATTTVPRLSFQFFRLVVAILFALLVAVAALSGAWIKQASSGVIDASIPTYPNPAANHVNIGRTANSFTQNQTR